MKVKVDDAKVVVDLLEVYSLKYVTKTMPKIYYSIKNILFSQVICYAYFF